jgi:hypothetical protein
LFGKSGVRPMLIESFYRGARSPRLPKTHAQSLATHSG